MWNYIPNLATVLLAMLQLAKDWSAHQTTWRRAGVLCFIALLGVGGTINTYYSTRNANQLRAELEATRKALTPAKAELESSLGNVTDTLENLEVKELAVQPDLDDSVAFTLSVVNKSPVQANNGSIFVRICELCTFSEEPRRFIRPTGASGYDRQMMFAAIPAITGIAIPLKIKPPESPHRFDVAVTLRCENCIVKPTEILHINF